MAATTEIQINHENGLCRILEGEARRVFYSTPEAVGLRLLNLGTPNQVANLQWVDCLATKGVAFGARGDATYVLTTIPAQERVVTYRRSSAGTEYKCTFPPLLFSLKFFEGHLNKSSLWVIKPGFEAKLSVLSAEHTLCAFPYGNVYNHGGVCWGEILLRDIRQPIDAEQAFFASGFNGDLFHPYYLGATDSYFPDMAIRTKGILPIPPANMYTHAMTDTISNLGR
jgi:hypothetical protein